MLLLFASSVLMSVCAFIKLCSNKAFWSSTAILAFSMSSFLSALGRNLSKIEEMMDNISMRIPLN
jgi:hypothetical protein